MTEKSFLSYLNKNYFGRFVLIFLLNVLSVLLSVFTFVMIEPFVKLLFRGNIDDLSEISSFVINLISKVLSVDIANISFSVLILSAVSLYLLKNLFLYLSQFVMSHVRSHLTYTFRNLMYEKMISLPLGYFNNQNRGDVISRAVSDSQEAEYTTLSAVYQWLTDPITLLIYLSVLFFVNFQLTLWALLLFPVAFLIIGKLSHSLKKDSKTSKQRLGALLSHVEETISGLRVVYGFNAQDYFYGKYDALNHKFHDKQKSIYRKTYLASPLSEFLGVSTVMVVLVIGGSMVLSEKSSLSAELFITYIAIFSQVINPIKNISSAFADYKRGEAAIDRISDFLCEKDDISDNSDAVHKLDFTDSIEFENVSFAYPDEPDSLVLDTVNVSIKKGDFVAFVGESGSGKTTFSDLLMRFYDPVSGHISIDSVEVKNVKLRDYRDLFALVSQDIVLFHDSFANNIKLGFDASEQEVENAAKVAGIYDLIMSYPDGFDHLIGDRGTNLSGGQRQKLSIARAVLRKSPILVLDEATSAMDTDSEVYMQQSLSGELSDYTKVVIAHRLSTIRNADIIYVFEQGRVVECGNHEQLVEKQGVYYKLLSIQK